MNSTPGSRPAQYRRLAIPITVAALGVPLVLFLLARYFGETVPPSKAREAPMAAADSAAPQIRRSAVFTPPARDALPEGDFGAAVRRGRDIFVDTQANARAYVGNGLNCANCHLDEGRKPDSAPLWAAYVKYPAYRTKNDKVNSFEDRLAGCFSYSMDGTPPAYDSPEMVALVAYSYWLATGAPTGAELPGRGYPAVPRPAKPADAGRGALVFAQQCAICHGPDGLGTQARGVYAFPPLWGPDSYNGGAGMARVETAAAFIRANMPLGQPNTLTEQQAWDVASYINSHPRPADPRKR